MFRGAPNPRYIGIINSESYTWTGKYDQTHNQENGNVDLLHSSGNMKNLIHGGKKTLFGNTRQASRLKLLPGKFYL